MRGRRDWVLSCPLTPVPHPSPHGALRTSLGVSCIRPHLRQTDHPPHPTPPLQGKVFPRLRKRSSLRSVDAEDVSTGRATDYVFRIIYPGHRHEHSECPKPRSGGRGRAASPGARVGGSQPGPAGPG